MDTSDKENKQSTSVDLEIENDGHYSVSDFEYSHTMRFTPDRYVLKCKEIKTSYIMAMKVIRQPNDKDVNREYEKRLIEREIFIHSSLTHPNIVKFIKFFMDPRRVCILMEYCNCGNLYQANKKYGPLGNVVIATYMFQICSALKYMHDKGIMYRDVKTDNMLLTLSGEIKLCDFGSAAYFKVDGKAISFVGTIDYVSPEMAAENGPQYDHRTDVWSCGVVLYELITHGAMPFDRDTNQETLAAIRNLEYSIPAVLKDGTVPDIAASNLISQILVLSPEARLSIPSIISSEFISKYSEDRLDACVAAELLASTARHNRQFE